MAEFKLEDVVEQSVKQCMALNARTSEFRSNIDIDALNRAEENVGLGAVLPSQEAISYGEIKRKRDLALGELTEQIKPVYKDAKVQFVDDLSADIKALHYYEILKHLVQEDKVDFTKLETAVETAKTANDADAKKKAEEALKSAKEFVSLVAEAETLQDKVSSSNATGRMGDLDNYVRQSYGSTVTSLLVNTYVANGAVKSVANLASQIANSKRKVAIEQIKKGKMTGFIEDNIASKDEQGYAIQQAYALYNSKQETDYRKKKAEDAAKAK